jgi:hypothetical protein
MTTVYTPDLYEYKYSGNEERVIHVWITLNEFEVAQWALLQDPGISARLAPCPEDCAYRNLPHPNRIRDAALVNRSTQIDPETEEQL